jgi:hypothetical protein
MSSLVGLVETELAIRSRCREQGHGTRLLGVTVEIEAHHLIYATRLGEIIPTSHNAQPTPILV